MLYGCGTDALRMRYRRGTDAVPARYALLRALQQPRPRSRPAGLSLRPLPALQPPGALAAQRRRGRAWSGCGRMRRPWTSTRSTGGERRDGPGRRCGGKRGGAAAGAGAGCLQLRGRQRFPPQRVPCGDPGGPGAALLLLKPPIRGPRRLRCVTHRTPPRRLLP